MRPYSPAFGLATACSLFLQVGLAHAQAAQPVPYRPAQPVPTQPAAGSSLPPLPQSPQPAPATGVAPQPTGGGADTVYLKGGGMLRGTLVEMIPNDHATLSLPTGQTAIIEWGRIDHIERQGGGVGPGPGAPPPPPLSPTAPQPNEGVAFVHLDADRGIVLETRSTGEPRWQMACASPCDTNLPLGHEYRVVGEGIRPGQPFRLGVGPGERVSISVTGASKGAFIGGIVVAGIGVVGIITGLTLVLEGDLENNPVFGPQTNSGDGLITAGWITMAVGGVLTAVGIVLFVSNIRTKHSQARIGLETAPAAQGAAAMLKLPTWHDKTPFDTAFPKASSVPILDLSF